MRGHDVGAGMAAIRHRQISLLVVPDGEGGDMEHTPLTVAVPRFGPLPCRPLHKAEPSVAHVSERGAHPPERVGLLEQRLLPDFLCRRRPAALAARHSVAGTEVAVLVQPNPRVQLAFEESLPRERQLPVAEAHPLAGAVAAAAGVEREGPVVHAGVAPVLHGDEASKA